MEEEIIKSPKEDIALKQVLAIETANTQIKSLIVKGLKENINKEELNKQILEVINENGKDLISYPAMYNLYLNSMKTSTQRWFRYYNENIKKLNERAMLKLKRVGINIPPINFEISDANKFRPYVSNNKKGLAIIEDYQAKVNSEILRLANDNPTATIVDSNGVVKKRSLRNEAEVVVRFQANKKDIDRLKDKGQKLVITTTHADCSKRCQAWQGRIYSLDGTSGTIDGKKYIPLEEAMKGKDNDGNGIISGYNCRHRAIPYKSGMVMPTEYSQAVIRKEREIDNQQRIFERSIRSLKLKEQLMKEQGDFERAKRYGDKWKLLESDYRVFSLRNGRAFYPWRAEILNKKEQ